MKQKLLTILLLIAVVFATGILLGSAWKTSSADEVSKLLRQSELDAESFLVEQNLFDNFETNCELAEKRLTSLSKELWDLGKLLGDKKAEEKLGEIDYHFLKKKYHLMQIRTYVLEQKLQNDCSRKVNVILLYFDKNGVDSEIQGKILDGLVEQYNLHVFAIEHDYSNELKFLEDYYEIKTAPYIVVNFNHKLEGLQNSENIIPLLYG
jgi:hypothetical protein